jgi:hypothetical protein
MAKSRTPWERVSTPLQRQKANGDNIMMGLQSRRIKEETNLLILHKGKGSRDRLIEFQKNNLSFIFATCSSPLRE